jgi:myosin heavy subunit
MLFFSVVKLGAGFNVAMAVKGATTDPSTHENQVWFKHPVTSQWCLGVLLRPENGNLVIKDVRSKENVEVPEGTTFPHNSSHDEYHSNISDIDDLHEAPLLDLLRRRHEMGDIYTYSNFVLMCVNPHREIEGLYDEIPGVHVLDKNHPPHVHVIAQRAYTELNTGSSIEGGGIERSEAYHSQAILISGESGAGKTQACKQVIRYLAALSTAGSSNSVELMAIEKALVSCSPLLEALGNSTTRMNHNSSRFGRLTRILFTDGDPSLIYGAKIENFLLEKPRVTARTPNERTFHAFYQLLKCDDLCQLYGLSQSLIDHHYLASGRGEVKTIDDKENAQEWMQSMDLCLGGPGKKICLDIVAAILHLGNIQVRHLEISLFKCPPPPPFF